MSRAVYKTYDRNECLLLRCFFNFTVRPKFTLSDDEAARGQCIFCESVYLFVVTSPFDHAQKVLRLDPALCSLLQIVNTKLIATVVASPHQCLMAKRGNNEI